MDKIMKLLTVFLFINICGLLNATITVTDFRGKTVTLEKPAGRIACVLDNGLHVFYMLGVVKEIVALHKWSLMPDNPCYKFAVQIDPRIGKGGLKAVNGNVEEIIALKPDITVMWASESIIGKLEDSGLKVYGAQVNNFDEAYKYILDLGAISGKDKRAKELVDFCKSEFKTVSDAVSGIGDSDRLSGMFVWGPTLYDIAGNESTGSEIIRSSGGTIVAKDVKTEHLLTDSEQVIKWNPDAIIVWNINKIKEDDFYKDTKLSSVKAIKNKKVYLLPDGFFTDLWTPKFIIAVKAASMYLYPERYKNADVLSDSRRIIRKLYDFNFKY
jgi:iron complex transport system substrate-binding protein